MRSSPVPLLAGIAAACMALAVAACNPDAPGVPAEIARARQEAGRRACAAAEVLRRATSDVADLRETVEGPGDGSPAAELTRRAGTAALAFARAYHQHAELRVAGYAHLDSAYNYARRAADSVGHVQIARELAIRAPEAGTVEANVVAAYERDLTALLGDPDHPCNWENTER